MAIRRDAVQCKKEILNVGQEGSHGRTFFSIRKASLKVGQENQGIRENILMWGRNNVIEVNW
jgi:hypothetical protein